MSESRRDERPDPDALLARIEDERARAERGRLKIFFGASPGVGKTYAMLAEAQLLRAQGRDVVVGVVETHGRSETARLIGGPRGAAAQERRVPRPRARGVRSRRRARAQARDPARRRARAHQRAGLAPPEALSGRARAARRGHRRLHDRQRPAPRKPERHRRRHHRHQGARDACPTACSTRPTRSCWSTSRPTTCSQRLKEGKVYFPEQAARAIQNFFRKGNLLALRELSLRRTADRVDTQMRTYRVEHVAPRPGVEDARRAPGRRRPRPRRRVGRARGGPSRGGARRELARRLRRDAGARSRFAVATARRFSRRSSSRRSSARRRRRSRRPIRRPRSSTTRARTTWAGSCSARGGRATRFPRPLAARAGVARERARARPRRPPDRPRISRGSAVGGTGARRAHGRSLASIRRRARAVRGDDARRVPASALVRAARTS